jgi:hypothetical protein
LARQLIAASLSTPKLSGAGAEIVAQGIASFILETLQIPYTEENILNIMPYKMTMVGWIEDLAVSILFIGSVQMDEEGGIGAYLATDKADKKAKKGLAKCILKWSSLLAT